MKNLIKSFPFNLVNSVYGGADGVLDTYTAGLIEALDTLEEREKKVILKRFRDRMTLAQVGEGMSITRERVRQIEAKALRKLRHPSRIKLMQGVSLVEYNQLYAELNDLKLLNDELNNKLNKIVKDIENLPHILDLSRIINDGEFKNKPIEELNFSVRTYNSLTRAGVENLRDLLNMTELEVMGIRNLGRKSLNEIVQTLDDLGYKLKSQ